MLINIANQLIVDPETISRVSVHHQTPKWSVLTYKNGTWTTLKAPISKIWIELCREADITLLDKIEANDEEVIHP